MKQVIAIAVVVAAVTGATTATAATLVTSARIKDGTIRDADIHTGAISLKKLAPAVRTQLAAVSHAVGLPGADGADGTDGANGVDGVAGSNGLPGTNGTNGSPGAPGSDGAPGAPGSPGTNGTNGTNGAPGAPGTNGTNGTNGIPGTPGAPGADGKNGVDADASLITSDNLKNMVLAPAGDNGDPTDNGVMEFSTPPVGASLGSKSLHMTTVTGKSVLLYVLPPGPTYPLLSTVNVASYSSLVHVSSGPVPGIGSNANFSWQFEVTGSTATAYMNGYTTVVYDPAASGQPLNTLDLWQHQSVDQGMVYSTKTLPSGHCSMASPCTFGTFVAENPAAVITTAKIRIGKNNGADWAGFDGYVDDLTLTFGPTGHFDLGG